MRVVNAVQADPYTGARRQVTYFADWLGCTSSLNAEIPQDFVLVDFDPSPEISKLYSRQLELEDTKDAPPPATADESQPSAAAPSFKPSANPFKMTEEERKELEDEVERLMSQYEKEGNTPSPNSNPFVPPSNIVFSIGIPKDIMEAWIENGFMDYLRDSVQDFLTGEFLDEIIDEDDEEPRKRKPKPPTKHEKISKNDWKEPNEKQKSDPKFGNKPNDWSPFVRDYLDDKKKDEGLDKPE
jgi:hypothetical protein